MADSADRALMVRPQSGAMTFTQMKQYAVWAAESKQFKGIKNPQQAMLRMQYGRELGFGPATALQSVYDVNGIPALKGNTIAARIKTVAWQGTMKPRYDYRVKARTGEKCVLEFWERNDAGVLEVRGEYEYTILDAKRTGDYDRNDNYRKRPKDMLFNRCVSGGARVFAPDCLGGIVPYTPDELGLEVDEDGAPVEKEGDVQDAEFTTSGGGEDNGISEEEFVVLQQDANAKNLCLGDVIGGLGGDPSDLRGITRGQYEAALRFIEQK